MRTFLDHALPRPLQAAVVACAVVVAASAWLLATGAPLLTRAAIASRGLPWGTLVAWGGLVALWLAVWLVYPPRDELDEPTVKQLRRTIRWGLFYAVTWGFVGTWLATNWAFNFSGEIWTFRGSAAAGKLFWLYTKVLVGLGVLFVPVTFYVRFGLAWQTVDDD